MVGASDRYASSRARLRRNASWDTRTDSSEMVVYRPPQFTERPTRRHRSSKVVSSMWVYENPCRTCSDPDTVGGGVSMLNTLLRFCAGSPSGRTNAYVSSAFQLADHLSSRPSRAGLSGTTRAPVVGASRLGAAGVA